MLPARPEDQAVWWLHKLEGELSARQAQMKLYDDYYRGEHPLPFLTPAHAKKLRTEFRRLLEESRTNFMRLVVDAVEERLRVEGFRPSASTDARADKRSWDIWQANQMDAESQPALVDALVKGVAYLSVWKTDEDDFPSIAVEDAMQTIVGYEPGSNFRRRAAALKIWRDDWTGMERANVYLPGGIYKFERAAAKETATIQDSASTSSSFSEKIVGGARRLMGGVSSGWVEMPEEFVGNPVGVVPIIPLRNRPRILVEGESEIADVVQVQNQINGFLFLLALAGYYGAHRQRWAAGFSPMGQQGTSSDTALNTATDSLWWTERPADEVKFGEFEQTDLSGYISAIEQKILHIAVTTRTPRHYLIEQGQSPSGDAIKSAESGLTKKVERKMRPFGEGLEEAMRLARRFDGEPDAPVDAEVVWADPEIRTEAEITDAAIKKWSLGLISWQQAVEDCGYTQTQIERMLEVNGGSPPQPPSRMPAEVPATA